MSRQPRFRWRLAGLSAALCVLAAVGGVPTAATASSKLLAEFRVDRTDSANPKYVYAWTVPNGVKRLTFEAFGATGGGSPIFSHVGGGKGGQAVATYPVTPGQVFQIVVGGEGGTTGRGGLNGGGSADGGGGGGASDVRVCADAAFKLCDLDRRFLVAGGGGGGGSGSGSCAGGNGGGISGATGGCFDDGGGGTQTEGGSPNGTFGFGGDGFNWGGGGGGGWYGGGGAIGGGGGGGGSGHISPPAESPTLTIGVWSGGDGKVVIYKAG